MIARPGMVTPPLLCRMFQDKVPSNSGSLSSVCVSQAMRKSVNNTTCVDASLKSEFNLINQMVVHTLALALRSFLVWKFTWLWIMQVVICSAGQLDYMNALA